MAKKFMFVWGLIILISLVIAFGAKASFWQPDADEFYSDGSILVSSGYNFESSAELNIFDVVEEDLTRTSADLIDELYEVSDLVIVGTLGERKILKLSTLSEINVSKVIKGDDSLVGSSIYMFEQSYFIVWEKDELDFRLVNGNTPLYHDYDFVLFLKHKEYPAEYIQNDRDKRTYNMVKGVLGKYSLGNEKYYKLVGTNVEGNESENDSENNGRLRELNLGDLSLEDLSLIDICSSNKQLIEKYLETKKAILNTLN